jgi:HJR/Mrr/RecB family endonuclease
MGFSLFSTKTEGVTMAYHRRYYASKPYTPTERLLDLVCPLHGNMKSFLWGKNNSRTVYGHLNPDTKEIEPKCCECLMEEITKEEDGKLFTRMEKYNSDMNTFKDARGKYFLLGQALWVYSLSFPITGILLINIHEILSKNNSSVIPLGLCGFMLVLSHICSYCLSGKVSMKIPPEPHKPPIANLSELQELHVNKEHKIILAWEIYIIEVKKSKLDYTMDDIDKMSGNDFEIFVSALLQKLGYINTYITPATGDNGVDIITNKNERKIAVQCKRLSTKVSNSAIQEVFSGKHFYKCDDAMVVTNSYFTENAFEAARKLKVQLIHRKNLLEMLMSINADRLKVQNIVVPEWILRGDFDMRHISSLCKKELFELNHPELFKFSKL